MQVQKSFSPSDNGGKLYLIATPIGNLEDMTYRAVRLLGEVDIIAAEDTRQTRKLLTHFEIQTYLTAYHEHNKEQAGKELLQKLEDGQQIALVSDAGLPAISDPGYELVRDAAERGIAIIPVPGANAALSALIVSGLSTTTFSFIGFLPRSKKHAITKLSALNHFTQTLLFYEAPHRITKTLALMKEIWPSRRIAIARELTKKHEEIVRGTVSDVYEWQQQQQPRGEYCIVVEGSDHTLEDVAAPDSWWEELEPEDHVTHYEQEGISRMDAIKRAAADRGMTKRALYQDLNRVEITDTEEEK